MKFSIDYYGAYVEYKQFFDEFARAMQARDHEVGILSGVRASEAKKFKLGFVPNFVRTWTDDEIITNANMWLAQSIHDLDIMVHFDDDAKELKKWTDRLIMKTLNSNRKEIF